VFGELSQRGLDVPPGAEGMAQSRQPGNTEAQHALIRELIQAPVADATQSEWIWQGHVYTLNGQYDMAD
jgi:chemotaxis response regulator CheB